MGILILLEFVLHAVNDVYIDLLQHRSLSRCVNASLKQFKLVCVVQDLQSWCHERSEVEIVDMVLRLREKLNLVNEHKLDVPPQIAAMISLQLDTITHSLPEDLRGILLKS